jgi:histidinol-phosphate/aromatic aminotransferase/cobyric acid decarboxylase-like protein
MSGYSDFIELKKQSGLHSPSVSEMSSLGIDIKVDSCFLCNPYAFDLFMEYYNRTDLSDYVKYYPPQNSILAKELSESLGLDPDYVFLGNGAIQIIELILREYHGRRKGIVTPTFSTYYEYDEENISYFKTRKEENFKIDIKELIKFSEAVEVLVLVNPNNPTGSTLTKSEVMTIVDSLEDTIVIVDESFIDFFDSENSVEKEVYDRDNLIVLRSMSKDFGIAGLRLGYSVLSPTLKQELFKKYGLLWNINGLAHFFIHVTKEKAFKDMYLRGRNLYLKGREIFYENLKEIEQLKTYPSKSNFFLIEEKQNIEEVFSLLLFEYGIYTRILNDKRDLNGSFLRVACGKEGDNEYIYQSLKEIFVTR